MIRRINGGSGARKAACVRPRPWSHPGFARPPAWGARRGSPTRWLDGARVPETVSDESLLLSAPASLGRAERSRVPGPASPRLGHRPAPPRPLLASEADPSPAAKLPVCADPRFRDRCLLHPRSAHASRPRVSPEVLGASKPADARLRVPKAQGPLPAPEVAAGIPARSSFQRPTFSEAHSASRTAEVGSRAPRGPRGVRGGRREAPGARAHTHARTRARTHARTQTRI